MEGHPHGMHRNLSISSIHRELHGAIFMQTLTCSFHSFICTFFHLQVNAPERSRRSCGFRAFSLLSPRHHRSVDTERLLQTSRCIIRCQHKWDAFIVPRFRTGYTSEACIYLRRLLLGWVRLTARGLHWNGWVGDSCKYGAATVGVGPTPCKDCAATEIPQTARMAGKHTDRMHNLQGLCLECGSYAACMASLLSGWDSHFARTVLLWCLDPITANVMQQRELDPHFACKWLGSASHATRTALRLLLDPESPSGLCKVASSHWRGFGSEGSGSLPRVGAAHN